MPWGRLISPCDLLHRLDGVPYGKPGLEVEADCRRIKLSHVVDACRSRRLLYLGDGVQRHKAPSGGLDVQIGQGIRVLPEPGLDLEDNLVIVEGTIHR